MKKSLLILFIFSFVVNSFAGDYFYYYRGDKMMMYKTEKTLLVKFPASVSSSSAGNFIRNSTGAYLDKTSEFSPASQPFRYVVVNLKDNTNASNLNQIKNKLLKSSDVLSVGSCFPSGKKVKEYTTDEIIVKFKKYVLLSEIETVNTFYQTTVIEKCSGMDNVYLLSIKSRGEENSDNVFDVSNKYVLLNNLVEFAQPNFLREGMILGADFKPVPPPLTNDSLVTQMWHIKNTGTNNPDNVQATPGCDMNMDSAWAITSGNPNVIISITDTGVDTNQVDLTPTICDRRLWYDAVDNNQRPYDQYYHGTGVAGCTSAAGNNHIGTVGTAYSCKFMPVRVFGPYPNAFSTDLILAKGLNWSWQHGASVINCSWGGGLPTPLISDAIDDAVHNGRQGKGTVIFAGSGNDNVDSLLYPGSYYNVIGVGGLGLCNNRKNPQGCEFNGIDSNEYWGATYGPGLSFVAPCTFIGTTELLGGWCICGNGTSCSSPLAAGVGALIISRNGNMTYDSVRNIMERSAKRVGNYSYNVSTPNGPWNIEMGHGRLDAYACLLNTPSGPPVGTDIIPPKIIIYPPESGVLNYNVSVNATITDNNSVSIGVNSPRLYYHTIQNSQLQVIYGSLTSPNNYSFTFPRIPNTMSLYYYIAAQDDYSNVTTYPPGGKGTNPPGTVKPAKLMFLRNTTTYDTSIISTDVPKPIIAPIETIVYSVYNNPVNKTVLDLDCWVNIAHNFDADLSISLISPSGTECVLVGGVGGDSSQNFTNTYFDDEASIQIDSTGLHAPFTGNFRPLQRLWFFDGEQSGGVWTLKILDNGRGDNGQLIGWGMKFRYSSQPDYVQLPGIFSIVRNYPNPFNPQTRIVFNVPYFAAVRLVLYDILGRKVATILNEKRSPALEDFVDFNISSVDNGSGSGIASGVYFISMFADDKYIQSKKIMLIK